MGNKIMQETTPFVECSAFHRGMSVLEANLRNTEDSEAIISGLLKGAAEFYGASRASVVEADWDLGIGVITYEWCKRWCVGAERYAPVPAHGEVPEMEESTSGQ